MVYADIYINLENNMEIKKRRVTDLIWSQNTYRLNRIVQEPGNHALHYLQDGLDRAVVHEELTRIAEDTQVLPEWVSKWK